MKVDVLPWWPVSWSEQGVFLLFFTTILIATMKPVAIFRHSPGEGPGYFAQFLAQHAIPWHLIRVDEGEDIPEKSSGYAGLVFMGGPMSVNDPLPWVEQECALIRDAVAADVPVLGHCLGGQLMSKALGGQVSRNPIKEIGWGEVSRADNVSAQVWLDGVTTFLAFHWHGETFSLPEGAALIMSSAYCPHQAFVLGKHLGMQCHVEMTEEMIHEWNRHWQDEVNGQMGPGIQTPAQMTQDLAQRLQQMRAVADGLYRRWIDGLKH